MNWEHVDHVAVYRQKAGLVALGFNAQAALRKPQLFGLAVTQVLDDVDAAHKAITKDKGLSDALKQSWHEQVVTLAKEAMVMLAKQMTDRIDKAIASAVPGEDGPLFTFKALVEYVTAAALEEATPGEGWQPRGVKLTLPSGAVHGVRSGEIWSEISMKQTGGGL